MRWTADAALWAEQGHVTEDAGGCPCSARVDGQAQYHDQLIGSQHCWELPSWGRESSICRDLHGAAD